MTEATTKQLAWLEGMLKAFKERSAGKYHILALGYFGSFARGTAREDSDVDIVFETDAPNLFSTVEMKCDLEALLGRRVDLLRLKGLTNHRLRMRIEKEVVYV